MRSQCALRTAGVVQFASPKIPRGNAMKPSRRTFLGLAATAAAFPAVSRIAKAQGYPTRPVRIIVGYPPGDSPDTVARTMARWLSDRLGQQFFIENKPGAGTNIAVQAAL